MSHIAQVGRRSFKVRAGIFALYVVLILGALTTVYPFLLMVTTGMKSQVDYNEYTLSSLVPRYFYDDKALFTKYAEDRYANNLDDMNAAHNAEYAKPADAQPPANAEASDVQALAKDWGEFSAKLPPVYKKAGFGEHDNAPSRLLLLYRAHLREKFHDDLTALNKAWTEENVIFDGVFPPFERTALRDWTPDLSNPKVADWNDFKATLPTNFLVMTTADALYQRWLREDIYEEDIAKLNAAWQTDYKSWSAIILPMTTEDYKTAAARNDWEQYLRTKLPLRMLKVVGAAPETLPAPGPERTKWVAMVATVPVARLRPETPENLWREHLKTAGLTSATGLPPQAVADWNFVRTHGSALRQEFAGRNFRYVTNYIFRLDRNQRSVMNTVLFCTFAVLGAIIVNPLCAYALARYPLPYAYKVLLFLLATMAFPAEVAMIPNFLLLRDLGLLNTFGALVLPGLANGFSIFLLKGFFDSLPKELYEAGILDGASEVTMFRTITVPLSMPIFSVIALNAFTASYGAFLFAMVVCQDPKMWTLMVWLYNLQDTAPQYVIMAALTLAAIPTLAVFLLAQKVILRGIILPSFK
jgi:multiple sugar transport system permease protein